MGLRVATIECDCCGREYHGGGDFPRHNSAADLEHRARKADGWRVNGDAAFCPKCLERAKDGRLVAEAANVAT